MTSKFDAAVDLTLDLLRVIQDSRDGTTIQQAEVLLALVLLAGDADTVVTQDQIGAYLRRPQGGPISKQLDKWVDAGVIEKEFVPGSQLYRQYPLTAKGKALLTQLRQLIAKAKG